MTELSPAARAVLEAAAVSACLAEWGPVNDPPCHPDDEGWNGCHLCVKRDLIAAALRAAADQVVPQEPLSSGGMRPGGTGALTLDEAQMFQRSSTRRRLLTIATELENCN